MPNWVVLQTPNSAAILKGAIANGFKVTGMRLVGAAETGRADEGGMFIAFIEIILSKGNGTIKCFATRFAVPDGKTVIAYKAEVEAAHYKAIDSSEVITIEKLLQRNEDDWMAERWRQ